MYVDATSFVLIEMCFGMELKASCDLSLKRALFDPAATARRRGSSLATKKIYGKLPISLKSYIMDRDRDASWLFRFVQQISVLMTHQFLASVDGIQLQTNSAAWQIELSAPLAREAAKFWLALRGFTPAPLTMALCFKPIGFGPGWAREVSGQVQGRTNETLFFFGFFGTVDVDRFDRWLFRRLVNPCLQSRSARRRTTPCGPYSRAGGNFIGCKSYCSSTPQVLDWERSIQQDNSNGRRCRRTTVNGNVWELYQTSIWRTSQDSAVIAWSCDSQTFLSHSCWCPSWKKSIIQSHMGHLSHQIWAGRNNMEQQNKNLQAPTRRRVQPPCLFVCIWLNAAVQNRAALSTSPGMFSHPGFLFQSTDEDVWQFVLFCSEIFHKIPWMCFASGQKQATRLRVCCRCIAAATRCKSSSDFYGPKGSKAERKIHAPMSFPLPKDEKKWTLTYFDILWPLSTVRSWAT